MGDEILTEIYRTGSAATDAGLLDWLRTIVLSGALLAVLRSTVGRGLVAFGAVMTLARVATAQPMSEFDMEQRLHFLESKLAAEQSQARWYEGGWSMVYIGGVGYGAYQIGNAGDDKAAMAEGIVGISKSLIGAGTLVLNPLKAGHTLRELRECQCDDDTARRLALAESLLRRNAKESDLRYAWQAHVVSLALNLLGGAIVWIAGDVKRAGQSTGIAVAAGEVQLWTLPWVAKKHAREYRREFGGFAF
jgi:hypothetical protein